MPSNRSKLYVYIVYSNVIGEFVSSATPTPRLNFDDRTTEASLAVNVSRHIFSLTADGPTTEGFFDHPAASFFFNQAPTGDTQCTPVNGMDIWLYRTYKEIRSNILWMSRHGQVLKP
ncbi:uncharacterized protein LOC132641301 isoform X2 [Lycium barbarum]|uniref:uncharacterized protein LOC132641301 isoform X2 n=1 Tax=Lycium barbarum TaxID=112863 RepID=UPI00293F5804|nr:uncharacterized protein LOC132641301 isoform X2 [Lycium barbarum]